jgi:integrase
MFETYSKSPKKLPETISEADVIKLISNTNMKHHKLAFLLGFYQAMRVSEVVKLQPEDIDEGQKIIRIKDAKGSKDRNIPIAPQVWKALKLLPIGCGIRALEIALKTKAKKILGRDLHFHSLRHSGATYYLNDKHWDSRQVQVFLGHSSLQTTQIYTHVRPQDLVDIMWK